MKLSLLFDSTLTENRVDMLSGLVITLRTSRMDIGYYLAGLEASFKEISSMPLFVIEKKERDYITFLPRDDQALTETMAASRTSDKRASTREQFTGVTAVKHALTSTAGKVDTKHMVLQSNLLFITERRSLEIPFLQMWSVWSHRRFCDSRSTSENTDQLATVMSEYSW